MSDTVNAKKDVLTVGELKKLLLLAPSRYELSFHNGELCVSTPREEGIEIYGSAVISASLEA